MTIDWKRDRWPHEHDYGSDSGYSATYNGHQLSVRENGGPYTVYVDGKPLPRDDGHEGVKKTFTPDSAKDYAQGWVDGTVKGPTKGQLLAPEFGFGFYQMIQTVLVSRVVDGKFEVRIGTPFEPRNSEISKIFKVGQDPTEWISKQGAKLVKKGLPK